VVAERAAGLQYGALWAQLIPAVVAVLAYLGALRNGFAYDDVPVISENEWIRSGTELRHALTLPYWPHGALYRPVTSFTFALDWLAGHGSPFLFHLGNIVWYAVGVALVARLALRWWPPLIAGLAGLLFALHPVHVEAVANIVGRSELLAGVALLGLALVVTAPGPVSPGRLVAVTALSVLAIGSKETGALAPVIAWAALRARPGEPTPRADVSRVVIASLFGLCIMALPRVEVLGTLGGDRPHPAFTTYGPGQTLALALATLPHAVALVIVPQLPRPDYSPPAAAIVHPSILLVLAGAILVVGAVSVMLVHARRPSAASFAGVFGVVTFAPVSNLVLHTGVVLAERTLYSPSVGACLLAGGATAALIARREPALARVVAGVWLVVAGVGAWFTLGSVGIWRDNASVFQAMVERAPSSYHGYYMLAKAQQGAARDVEAHRLYVRAIGLFAGDPRMMSEAGFNAAAVGDTSDAVAWLSAALARSPASPVTRSTLIALDLRRGDRALLHAGVTIYPNQASWRALMDSLDRVRQ